MKPTVRTGPKPGLLEEPNRLSGYAAKFDEESSVLFDEAVCDGPFVEVIRPGAFTKSLATSPDVRALYNHESGSILGRTKAGNLDLREDAIGLHFDLTLPDTSVARDVRANVACGNIDGCSFGFFVIDDQVTHRPGKPALRELLEVHVFEITPATAFPAYDATEVSLRSRKPAEPAPPAARPGLAIAKARLRLSRD